MHKLQARTAQHKSRVAPGSPSTDHDEVCLLISGGSEERSHRIALDQ